MPRIPEIVTYTNVAKDVLNFIRENASQNYRNYVPFAQDTKEANNIREIGTILMDYPNLQNEFLQALVNRIAMVIVTSKSYRNKLSMFKRGFLELGEVIEEVFVNIAKPKQFDPRVAEETVFRRHKPDVRSAFYVMNWQKYYPVTIEQERLRQAFLSYEGINGLISYIVESLYTGMEYDEQLTMQYMIARQVLDGKFYYQSIAGVSTKADSENTVKTIKTVSDNIEFLSDKYNVAGVYTYTDKSNMYIIMTTAFDSSISVDVLAAAFNMEKADFIGRRVLVPSFGELDNKRLAILFEHDDTYKEITSDEMSLLNDIGCLIVDESYFMILDNLTQTENIRNPEGLYTNYFAHFWKTFGISPFANAICLTTGAINNMYADATEIMVLDTTTGEEVGLLTEIMFAVGGDYLLVNANDNTALPVVRPITVESNSEYVKVINNNRIIVTGMPQGDSVEISIMNEDKTETISTVTVTVGA